jgi:hypothetical protein
MGMVAPQQRIASAYFVFFGSHGDVTRYAEERGVCRQWVYREADWLRAFLAEKQTQILALEQRVQELQQQNAALAERVAVSVVLDEDMQARLAAVGQATGISLPAVWQFLDVMIPGKQLSVPTLGRRSKAAGDKAGPLLAVVDEWAKERLRDAAADELYVNDPVRMVVEQESLCWISGRLGVPVDGDGWAEEFRQLPNLEQLARDGGKGLAKGVAIINAERHECDQSPVVDKGDHFHALRGAGVGLRRVEKQAAKALAEAEEAQRQLEDLQRRGEPSTQGAGKHAGTAWRKAETAMDLWCDRKRLWQQTKAAMQLVTPTGELNTRQHAQAVLAETLPQLPDSDFAKTKAQIQKPEMLNFLDDVQQQIEALPFPEEVKQAAVRQECLRRRPEMLKGEGTQAGAKRGLLLVCAVILGKAEAVGQQAVAAVQDILRRAYRASSLVECINSAVRMHQSRHRKMTQSLLDLKRLYWNCHTFRTGRRRGTTPYQRLGVPWPEGLRWWDVLKLTPEQLRHELSTAKMPP